MCWPCSTSTAGHCPVTLWVSRPTASWGCTMLPTQPRRPHLKIECLYWYLSAQVQCVPTSTQAGKASWAKSRARACVSWHTHTYKEMNKL